MGISWYINFPLSLRRLVIKIARAIVKGGTLNMYEKILSAYVTNLGKYTEGELIGKWLDFPTTEEKIQEVLQEIGIDGIRYNIVNIKITNNVNL